VLVGMTHPFAAVSAEGARAVEFCMPPKTGQVYSTPVVELEIAPGIHQIESFLGPRPFSHYLLRGERSLLVETGVAGTPEAVIFCGTGPRPGMRPIRVDRVAAGGGRSDGRRKGKEKSKWLNSSSSG
jgi:hypothetical protein